MDSTLTIIVMASLFALVAVRLIRRYNEKVKGTMGKDSSGTGKPFTQEDEDEYEPYRGKAGK